VRLLGRGTSGEVWAGDDPHHGRIAVKILQSELGASARERLLREHHVLTGIHHPNVVQVVQLYREPRLALGMELVEGRPLLEALDGDRSIEAAQRTAPERIGRLIALLAQLLDALDAVHAAGLVHRDVKPANAIVNPAGTLKLLDLGLAADTPSATAGTLRYMAPEALAGLRVDARADLYSVGVIAFEALSGTVPFGDRAEARTFAAARMNETAPRLDEIDPTIPSALAETVGQLLAHNPADRPATAIETARRLTASAGAPDSEVKRRTALRVNEPELLGRGDALITLASAAATAWRGESYTVHVVGPPGSGRTRLLGAWLTSLDRGVLTLRVDGRADVRSLAAFTATLDEIAFALGSLDAMAVLQLLPTQARALAELSPRMNELNGFDLLPPLVPLAGAEAETRSVQAVRDLLENVAKTRPIALAIDDLDEAGPATRRVVQLLSQSLAASLALVVTSREDHALPADETIALPELTAEEVGSLAGSALPVPPAPALVTWLTDVASGSPQRAMDALRAAERIGALILDGARADIEPSRRDELAATAIADALADSLSTPARQVAQALATFERGATLDEVAAVAQRPTGETARALQELIATRLAEESPAGVRYRAESVRGAIRATTDEADARTLHRRAARALQTTDPLRAVRHHIAAGDVGRALPRLGDAVLAELHRGSLERAARWATIGLDHLAGLDRRRRALEITLLTLRARVAIRTGDVASADQDLNAANDALPRVRDDRIRRQLLEASWTRHRSAHRWRELEPAFDDYLQAAVRRGDGEAEAYARNRLGQLRGYAGDLDDSERHLQRALDVHLARHDRAAVAGDLNALGLLYVGRNDYDRAATTLRRGLAFARHVGLPETELTILLNLATVASGVGRYLEWMHTSREGLDLACRIGNRQREGMLALNLGSSLINLGQFAESGPVLDAAERALKATDNSSGLAVLALNRGLRLLRLGRLGDAVHQLEAAAATDHPFARLYVAKAHCLRAEAHLMAGETAAATTAMEQARRYGREQGSDWTDAETDFLAAWRALDAGDHARAAELTQSALADADRRHDRPLQARARLVLARALGDVEMAVTAVHEAIDVGDVTIELEARAALVSLLDDAGDQRRAATERRAGRTLAERVASRCGVAHADFLRLPHAYAFAIARRD